MDDQQTQATGDRDLSQAGIDLMADGKALAGLVAHQAAPATQPKWAATSKTIGLNLAALLFSLLAENSDQVASMLPPEWAEIALPLLVGANLLLRRVTSSPITLRRPRRG